MPNQDETSNFASSGALSRMVGTFGASAARSGVVTASGVELAVLNLRQRRIEIVEQDLDIAGKRSLQRRTGAAERHMDHLQAGQLQEPGAGEVRALPDAGGAIGELVRIGLDIGDQFPDRLDAASTDVPIRCSESGSGWKPAAADPPCRSCCGRCCRRSRWGRDCRPGWCVRPPLLRTASAVPMVPPPPERFSTTADWPQAFCRCAASNRPITSVVPPGCRRHDETHGLGRPPVGAVARARQDRRRRNGCSSGQNAASRNSFNRHKFTPCLESYWQGP